MTDLLDADTLIDAKNRYYDFDVCPGFWDWIDQQFDTRVARGRAWQPVRNDAILGVCWRLSRWPDSAWRQ